MFEETRLAAAPEHLVTRQVQSAAKAQEIEEEVVSEVAYDSVNNRDSIVAVK